MLEKIFEDLTETKRGFLYFILIKLFFFHKYLTLYKVEFCHDST